MISIRKLAPTFAAEVRGLDLRRPISSEVFAEIYAAFLEYGVLVLPGQAISIQQHLEFASIQ